MSPASQVTMASTCKRAVVHLNEEISQPPATRLYSRSPVRRVQKCWQGDIQRASCRQHDCKGQDIQLLSMS